MTNVENISESGYGLTAFTPWPLFTTSRPWEQHTGLYSLRRRRLISIGIPIINLRRSSDHLRFSIGIPIPVRGPYVALMGEMLCLYYKCSWDNCVLEGVSSKSCNVNSTIARKHDLQFGNRSTLTDWIHELRAPVDTAAVHHRKMADNSRLQWSVSGKGSTVLDSSPPT